MNKSRRLLSTFVVVTAVVVIAGSSAVAKEKKSKAVTKTEPAKVKFSEFKAVELKLFGITPEHAENKGNQKSAEIMDELLLQELRILFPNLTVVPAGTEFSKASKRTLQITPMISNIRKVSTGARIWAGAMAGSSFVEVQVTYRDSSTGEVIAQPQFRRSVSGWTDGWGEGGNKLRDDLCRDIANYTQANK
jgi:hypothetical protein